jgi:hypothetical protein
MYMFSVSKEHILISLLSLIAFKLAIRWTELRELCVYVRYIKLCNVFVRCFANSYAGAIFQLIICLMGVFGLCSFIVRCSFGTVGFIFVFPCVFFLYGVITLF